MRPTAWCRWAVEAGICWAEKAARWELIPRGPCCTWTQEQNNYRTENDSALHIMMAESSGQNIFKLYGQPAGIFEDYVSAGRKKLVIG